MTVKKKKTKLQEGDKSKDALRNAIVFGVEKLFDLHVEEMMSIIEDSENHKLGVGFGVDMDFSESEPIVTTGIRFSTAVTDRVTMQITDPSQGEFEELIQEVAPARPKKAGRGKSESDKPDATAAESGEE